VPARREIRPIGNERSPNHSRRSETERFEKEGWQEPYELRGSRTESVRDWR